MYLIKPNGNLGYSLVETSNTSDSKREIYEAAGYRVVNEFEFTIARILTQYDAPAVIRQAQRLAEEMGAEGELGDYRPSKIRGRTASLRGK